MQVLFIGQPPSGGCVLKLCVNFALLKVRLQPPSGGRVLKRNCVKIAVQRLAAAAFGRLCVETISTGDYLDAGYAAAFGRLCVETSVTDGVKEPSPAAAFGRLCVETPPSVSMIIRAITQPPSRG